MALLYAVPQFHHLPLSTKTSPPPLARSLVSLQAASRKRRGRESAFCCLTTTSDEAPATKTSIYVPEPKRILWSDVEVKQPAREVYLGRKWSSIDVGTAAGVLSIHALAAFAPFAFTWGALWTAVALYVATGMIGISLSYHRNLSHRSLVLPRWLEYTFAYCGLQAVQGDPIDWVSTHACHHSNCDAERDPHSPTEGFWFGHMSWLFDKDYHVQKCEGVISGSADEMAKQPFYRFLQQTYAAHPIALGLLLYAAGGFPYVVWGMGVRTVFVYHATWLVNSACHVWGSRPWKTGDLSRNNWVVAALAFGEGWHNNHHAFGYSAKIGLKWWEVDITWYFIRLLQAVGLATDVKVPAESHKRKLSAAAVEGPSTPPSIEP